MSKIFKIESSATFHSSSNPIGWRTERVLNMFEKLDRQVNKWSVGVCLPLEKGKPSVLCNVSTFVSAKRYLLINRYRGYHWSWFDFSLLSVVVSVLFCAPFVYIALVNRYTLGTLYFFRHCVVRCLTSSNEFESVRCWRMVSIPCLRMT